MIRRAVTTELIQWFQNPHAKPLLVRGARQVGKTWVCRRLGAEAQDFLEINFEVEVSLRQVFEQYFGDPEKLVRNLESYFSREIVPGKTLLFFDEIQECPSAIMSLRYFFEKMPQCRVIATGSLLEFALSELGFPVGRVDFTWLHPLSFQEFLNALGVSTKDDPDVDAVANPKLREALMIYLQIGGLPKVVATWVETKSFLECQNLLQNLAAAYRADFSKYASRAKLEPVRIVFEQIPRLWGNVTKFSELTIDFRARELREAINLLRWAGLLTTALHTKANGVPLGAEASGTHFKLFSLDVGLGNRLLGLKLGDPILVNELIHRGGLMEQFVAQELRALSAWNEEPQLYFWQREKKSSQAEVDFVVARGPQVVPIEVKSGEKGKAKSLGIFISEKSSPFGLKLSMNGAYDREVGASDCKPSSVIRVPLYRAFQAFRRYLSDI